MEQLAKSCEACLSVRHSPPSSPLHPWSWPSCPWQHICVDFTGPLFGKMYLLVVDSHSKWLEIYEMSSTSTTATIQVFRQVFSVFGLPEQLVSDNGPKFISQEFSTFLRNNGIKHFKSALYHPSTNGAVEKLAQTFKSSLKKGKSRGRSSHYTLSYFLLFYRATPHATTGRVPCELMLRRPLRTILDLIKPNTGIKVSQQQGQQKYNHDTHSHIRQFDFGQQVMLQNYPDGDLIWVKGRVVKKQGVIPLRDRKSSNSILEKLGPLSVTMSDGRPNLAKMRRRDEMIADEMVEDNIGVDDER